MDELEKLADPKATRERLIAHFLRSSEGREKIAWALIEPARIKLQFTEDLLAGKLQGGCGHPAVDPREWVQDMEDIITISQQVLAASSNEEKRSNAMIRLRGILGDLQGERDRVRAKYP
jgi:hypothetical protein